MSAKEQQTTETVSTGAGIAIAGVWLAAAAITIALLLVATFGGEPVSAEDTVAVDPIMLLLLFASPLIAASWATKLILNKED